MEQLSQYEFEAITQLARSDKRTEILLRQLEKALCFSRDYTGVGLYTKIYVDPAAPKLDENRWKIQDMPKGHAEHPNLPLGASIILWIDGGYIACLESYTNEGNWPHDESLFRVSA